MAAQGAAPASQAGLKVLGRFIRRFWWHLGLLLLFIGLSVTASLLLPLLNRAIIDQAIGGKNLSLLKSYILYYLFIIVVISLTNFFREYFYGLFSNRLFHEARLLLFGKFLRSRLSILNDFSEGDLLTIITEDVKAIRNFMTEILLAGFSEIFTLLITLVLLYHLSPPMAGLSLAFFVLYLMCHQRFTRVIRERGARLRHSQGLFTGSLLEAIRGLLTVKVHNAYALEEGLLGARSRELLGHRLALLLLHAGLHQTTHLLLLGGGVLIWYVGGTLTISGALSLGTLVAVSEYFLRLMRPLTNLANANALFRADLAALHKVAALLEYPEEPLDLPAPGRGGGAPLWHRHPPLASRPRLGEIRTLTCERVSYQPPGRGEPLLREVSFTLRRGDKVALIGPSGAGKSTLACLLVGLLTPTGGRILLNGRDLQEWDLVSLRERLAYTPQTPMIFSRAVEANLKYAATVTEAELSRMVRLLGLEELGGTAGEHRGAAVHSHNLSGGEAQRLALGRTLLRPAEVYLLDESFSQVDKALARSILEELLARRDLTCLVITHDLTLLERFEKVLLLEEGTVRVLPGGRLPGDFLLRRKGRWMHGHGDLVGV